MEVTRRRNGYSLVQQRIGRIVNVIKYYELREATTLFELALWKSKMIDRVDIPCDRNAYRVEVPGPVKDAILQYLL